MLDKAFKTECVLDLYERPDVQAFTDLMNRALDNPAEHVQIAGHDGGPLTIHWQDDRDGTLEPDSNVTDLRPSDVKQIDERPDEME